MIPLRKNTKYQCIERYYEQDCLVEMFISAAQKQYSGWGEGGFLLSPLCHTPHKAIEY